VRDKVADDIYGAKYAEYCLSMEMEGFRGARFFEIVGGGVVGFLMGSALDRARITNAIKEAP